MDVLMVNGLACVFFGQTSRPDDHISSLPYALPEGTKPPASLWLGLRTLGDASSAAPYVLDLNYTSLSGAVVQL